MKSFIKKSLSIIFVLCFMFVCFGLFGVTKVKASSATYTFTNKSWDDSTHSWTSGGDGNSLISDQGIQVTTGASGACATSNNSFDDVTQVVVNYCTNASKGVGSISITIGSNDPVSQDVTKTGGTTRRNLTYDFSPAQSGAITIEVTCTTNSIYVYSIQVITSGSDPVLESIAIKTNPKTAYEEGEFFDPTGLVITKTFDNSSTEDLAYAGHTSDFTFSPSLTTPLTTGDSTVTISVGGESANLSITVSPKSIETLVGELTNAASLKIDYSFNRIFELVTNVSQLSAGDEVIIVAEDSNVALSMTQNENNRGQVDITRSGSHINLVSNLQIFKLEVGTVDDTFAFYTPQGYIFAASSSKNYLKTQANKDDNSSFSIAINENIATITAQGTNTRNLLQYNSTYSLFSCYSSAQSDIQLYKAVSKTTTLDSVSIRFQVNMTTALRTRIASEGTSIEYGYLYAQGEKNAAAMTYGASGVESKVCSNSNDDGSYALVLTGVPSSGWGTKVTVRAYVCIDGTYYYSSVRNLSVKEACGTYISTLSSEEEVKKAIWILDYIKNYE